MKRINKIKVIIGRFAYHVFLWCAECELEYQKERNVITADEYKELKKLVLGFRK